MNFHIDYLHNFYKNLHNILRYKLHTYKIFFKTYIIYKIPIKYGKYLNNNEINLYNIKNADKRFKSS